VGAKVKRISIVVVFLLSYFTIFIIGCSDTLKPVPIKPIYPAIDGNPSWSPDSLNIIYYHAGITEILENGAAFVDPDSVGLWMINADGSNPHIILNEKSIKAEWSFDVEWIVFSASAQIYKAKIHSDGIDTTSIEQLTFNNGNYFPTCSPDGQWIAYDSDSGGHFCIWIMKSDGTQKECIKEYSRMPNWSPGGDRIVHVQYVGKGNPEIFSMDTSGGDDKQLSSNGEWNSYPKYSPDGMKIMFTSKGSIWMMNNNGDALQKVIDGGQFSWSPDGNKIVFIKGDTENHNNNGAIWIVNTDGTGLKQLTYGPR
jgi:Tol biopolymer transport system component